MPLEGYPTETSSTSGGHTMKVVHCPCGTDVQGDTDDQLVENVQAHIASDHPEMVGQQSREQILEMAHDH
jgi:hypothetical protein